MLLGERLRQLREASGMTRADAGCAIRGSHAAKISRMETGRDGFKRRDVADLLALYGVRDEIERDGLLMLVERANTPGWRQDGSPQVWNDAGQETGLADPVGPSEVWWRPLSTAPWLSHCH
jgi:transcriptional regulator with XRE-family HTH domain